MHYTVLLSIFTLLVTGEIRYAIEIS